MCPTILWPLTYSVASCRSGHLIRMVTRATIAGSFFAGTRLTESGMSRLSALAMGPRASTSRRRSS